MSISTSRIYYCKSTFVCACVDGYEDNFTFFLGRPDKHMLLFYSLHCIHIHKESVNQEDYARIKALSKRYAPNFTEALTVSFNISIPLGL